MTERRARYGWESDFPGFVEASIKAAEQAKDIGATADPNVQTVTLNT